jgi:hypothetical protein
MLIQENGKHLAHGKLFSRRSFSETSVLANEPGGGNLRDPVKQMPAVRIGGAQKRHVGTYGSRTVQGPVMQKG